MPDLASLLHVDTVDHDELFDVLAQTFSSATHAEDGSIVYPSNGEPAVRVTAKNDRITSIEAGPALTATATEQLARAVENELLADHGSSVYTKFLFAARPVTGCHRHEALQILPA